MILETYYRYIVAVRRQSWVGRMRKQLLGSGTNDYWFVFNRLFVPYANHYSFAPRTTIGLKTNQ